MQNITGDLMCIGMEFNYPYKSEADGYVDIFTPNGGSLIFESQDGNGRVGCYSGSSDNYRTITSSVFFSVLQETITARQELMATYMGFFTGGTGIAEDPHSTVSAVNPVLNSFSAAVTLQESAYCDLGLFDITGRRVGNFVSGSLTRGTHNLIVSATGMSSGTYLIFGTVGKEQVRLRTVLLR